MAKENTEEKLTIDFFISDNSLNRNGYRILTEGISFDNFLKNPVCCVQHDTWSVSVGKWTKIWKENGILKGTCQFDSEDPDAVKLYKKYKNGYMSAVSISVLPIEKSEDKKDLLPGQKYPTVKTSDLLEISLVTLPGNANSIKLTCQDGTEYKLNLISKKMDAETENKDALTLRAELAASRKLNGENLIKIHTQRGVVQTGEVESLTKLAAVDYDSVKTMLEARTPLSNDKTDAEKKSLAKQLAQLHFDRGAIQAEELAFYENAAENDYEGTKKNLEAKKGKDAVGNFVASLSAGEQKSSDDRVGWGYYDYYKKDVEALNLMKTKEPEKYVKLEQAFLSESKKLGIRTETEE